MDGWTAAVPRLRDRPRRWSRAPTARPGGAVVDLGGGRAAALGPARRPRRPAHGVGAGGEGDPGPGAGPARRGRGWAPCPGWRTRGATYGSGRRCGRTSTSRVRRRCRALRPVPRIEPCEEAGVRDDGGCRGHHGGARTSSPVRRWATRCEIPTASWARRGCGCRCCCIGAFVIDIVPRTLWRSRGRPTRFRSEGRLLIREHWTRDRITLVVLGAVCFYVTYVSYRNLKNFLPFVRSRRPASAVTTSCTGSTSGCSSGTTRQSCCTTSSARRSRRTCCPTST